MLQYQLKMEDAPILRLLDSIITEGLVSGTSDILMVYCSRCKGCPWNVIPPWFPV